MDRRIARDVGGKARRKSTGKGPDPEPNRR
jgi:hypothetical protein